MKDYDIPLYKCFGKVIKLEELKDYGKILYQVRESFRGVQTQEYKNLL